MDKDYPTIIDQLHLLDRQKRMHKDAISADYELMLFVARSQLINSESQDEKIKWLRVLKELHGIS